MPTYIKTGPGGLEPSQIVEYCALLAELGVARVIFKILGSHHIRPIAVLAEDVIPRVRAFSCDRSTRGQSG